MSEEKMPSESTDGEEDGGTAITAEPSSLSSDCLLHAEHHVFDTDCWDEFVHYYRSVQYVFPQDSHEKLIARYSLAYEGKVLRGLIRKHGA